MGEARDTRDFNQERFQATQTVSAYEVVQTPSGGVGFYDNSTAANSGDYVTVRTRGTATLQKTTGFVALKGGRAYWDHSANKVYYKKVNDRDFYIGRFAADQVTASDNCEVILNYDPPYDIDLNRDAFISALAGTPAAGGFGYPVTLGGTRVLELSSTSEAQKVDLLSRDGFSKSANAIIEVAFCVLSDGAGTAPDVSLGAANATHATDADSITESLFIHLNGNDVNIYAESDDGSTEVAATDTTIDYTEGSTVATRVECWFDMRDPADVQIYVNGSLVLGSTVFNVDAATGPFFLLAHLEKTSAADVYKIAIDKFNARYAEQ